LSLSEDDEVEVIVDGSDDLLGVADAGLDILGEVAEGAVQQAPKEHEPLEDFLVGLAEIACLEGCGELVEELFVLLIVELLA
jgi:hypothetical protein